MPLFKKKSLIVTLTIISILIILSVLNYNRIKFEYYAWNLSSEDFNERENSAKEIIKMGDVALPFLIEKLHHRFIFETDYVVYCLEEITNAHTYDINKANFYNEVIPFWKKWWKKESYKYE